MRTRIRELRLDKKMSTEELAVKLKITARTIQRYENGIIAPPPDKLIKLSEIFGCSVDYLLCISDVKFYNGVSEAKEGITPYTIDNDTKKTFVERLKDRIVQGEITKDVLANSLKIEKTELNKYIFGNKFPDIIMLKKIASSLNTTIDFLVGLSDEIDNENVVSVAGEYLSKFEDEVDGVEVVTSAPAIIEQNGKKITGYTYVLNEDRKWIIEGEIASNGYLYGIYYAEKLTDQGIGNFFLEIENNGIMKGIWSGFDSVNDKITYGKYTFRPMFKDFEIVDLKNKHIPQVLDICDSELGKDYLSYEDLRNVIKYEEYICKVAVNTSTNDVIGFCMCVLTDPDGALNIISWPDNKLPKAIEYSEKIGVIKTIAVYNKYQGYGIGKKITEACYEVLLDEGMDSACSIAWRNGDVTNVGGVLTSLGFREFTSIENYWKDDSEEKGYDCPTCGNPCSCTGVIYIKIE
jgi:transcriptional regulator with XRE-family HTH domain/ribosomal protein S18 acetylase RimI-like enzyme